jgi:hypothetical protein
MIGKISSMFKDITTSNETKILRFKINVISPNKEFSTLTLVAYGDMREKVLNVAKINDTVILNCYAKNNKYKTYNGTYVNEIIFVILNIKVLRYNEITNIENIFNIENEIYADESLIFDENDIGKGVELLFE